MGCWTMGRGAGRDWAGLRALKTSMVVGKQEPLGQECQGLCVSHTWLPWGPKGDDEFDCRERWSWPQIFSVCTMKELQQVMVTSAHLLEKPALPERGQSKGAGMFL